MKKHFILFTIMTMALFGLLSCNSDLGLTESASVYGKYNVKIDGADVTVMGAGDSSTKTFFKWNGTSGTMTLQTAVVGDNVIDYVRGFTITMDFSGKTYPMVNEDLADFHPTRTDYTFAGGSAKVTVKDFGHDWVEVVFQDFKFSKDDEPTQVSTITGTVRMDYEFK